MAMQVQTLGRRVGDRFQNWCRQSPLVSSFIVCSVKGVAADIFTQKVVERRDRVDAKRCAVFAGFSGWYGGCAQHILYNRLMTSVLGTSTSAYNGMRKTAVDLALLPVFSGPLLYTWQVCLLQRPDLDLVWNKYKEEILNMWMWYSGVWGPAHMLTFTVIPSHLRISWVASLSLFWLVISSNISNSSYERRKQTPADAVDDR